ncbi:syntenin-2 isoform X11 [Physeter macrocephalus]|uniref:Syntenin-2 isoform X11 n=2 Tax=Physeter macrocephalus TaxID=9755 RepID=A0A9W2X596_PHYMC|nr:syntenin-2 isoform X11 [Physeter catodon]
MPALPGQGTDSQPSVLYPNLVELESYMDLSFSSHEVQQNLPQIPEGASAAVSGPSPDQAVAPVSGNNLGVLPGEVKPGVREIHLCKDDRGKTELRLRAIEATPQAQLTNPPCQAIPAERHHAQGQHRPRRLRHQEGEAHLFGQREFCGPQRAPHQPLRVRGERAERPWAEGQRSHGDSGHSRERHQPDHHPHCDLRAHGCPQPCSTTPWTTPSLTSEATGEQLSPLTLQQERESPQGTGCGGLLPGGGAVSRRACSGGVQHWITWACHLYTLASLEPQPLNWA